VSGPAKLSAAAAVRALRQQ